MKTKTSMLGLVKNLGSVGLFLTITSDVQAAKTTATAHSEA